MKFIKALLALLVLGERVWKHWLVVRFFRERVPPVPAEAELVSVLQPILSGDPTLSACLEHNLSMQTHYDLEFIWLVDTDDWQAQRICGSLIERYGQRRVRMLLVEPPTPRHNPKMVKLICGLREARGEIVCVLDDDTMLPDYGLEQCLPFLQQPQVGLAFGLPYYCSFATLWSGLVATFVNSHSLLTYIPYTTLSEPFTINGMFYAMRRELLDTIGGFTGLEETLADDFAVAERVRAQRYTLVQTPLRHAISTTLTSPHQYVNLMHRWFSFPRESLLRHLSGRELAVLYGAGMAPTIAPLVVTLMALFGGWKSKAFTLVYWGYSLFVFAHINIAFLHRATPWRYLLAMPLVQLMLPLHVLGTLLGPRRIVWRGHVIEAEQGGGLRFIERRRSEDR